MKFELSDIEGAYDFVSFGPYGDHSALLDRSTGKIHWHSESGDLDAITDDLWSSDDTIEIPHKNDLDLGRDLVFDFISSHSPDDYGTVQQIFRCRGAYSRYKELLESKGLLQKWYDFEQNTQSTALRQWCKDNDIELTG